MTATKNPTVYGDDLPIAAFQIKRIMQNCSYNVEIKNEWVQWVTGDVNRTSLKSITYAQAVKIIKQQTGDMSTNTFENWAKFDYKSSKHRKVLSILYQAKWTVVNASGKEVPDLMRLNSFLHSEKNPVKKPLLQMDPDTELPKLIKALQGVAKSVWK